MLISGKNAVLASIQAKRNIEALYVTNHILSDTQFMNQIERAKIKYTVLTKEQVLKQFKSEERIIALVDDYKFAKLEDFYNKETQVLVILDGLEDPHNLGAIIRTVEAAGFSGIIIPKNRSVGLTSTVAKVSTGAIEYVKIVEVTNLSQTINLLKEKNFWIYGLEIDGSLDYSTPDYSGNIAIVIGSEGKGISRLVKEQCDHLVKIPMNGKINSLNASVSAGIILYQVLLKRSNG